MRLRAPPELRERLLRHLQELVRERDPDSAPVGHAAVREYVARQLGAHRAVTVHKFKNFGRTHHNLILDLPGQQDGEFVLMEHITMQSLALPAPTITPALSQCLSSSRALLKMR